MNKLPKPTKEQQEIWHNDSANWKWGMFYVNKEDPRISLPKRNKNMGITLNFARPLSFILIAIQLLSVVLLTILLMRSNKS